MRVNKIRIENVLGIEELEIKPGKLTVITGANATGKSSVLESIRSLIGGSGHDATLLRKGATKGEVVMVIDDGLNRGIELRETITEKSTNRAVNHPDYGKVGKVKTFLNSIHSSISLNPVEFLTASKKERVEIFLNAIPMKVTAKDLSFVPVEIIKESGADLDAHALEVLERIRARAYEDRRVVNREFDGKAKTIAEMEKSVPKEVEDDWAAKLARLEDERTALYEKANEWLEQHNRVAQKKGEQIKEAYSTNRDNAKKKMEESIALARSEYDDFMEKETDKRDIALSSLHVEGDKKKKEYQEKEYQPESNRLEREIGEAKAKVEEIVRIKEAQRYVSDLGKDAKILQKQSTNLGDVISGVDVLKMTLLRDLPLAGVECQDGNILVDGIPFDRVNDAMKVQLAIKIAQLRAGSLGLCIVDGLEKLDPKTYEAFKQEAMKTDLQFIITRVTTDDLKIETIKGDLK